MTTAVMTPATASTGSGHHQGAGSNPNAPGSSLNTVFWSHGTTVRKHHAASATTKPITPDSASNRK